jgi:hypothetical protein
MRSAQEFQSAYEKALGENSFAKLEADCKLEVGDATPAMAALGAAALGRLNAAHRRVETVSPSNAAEAPGRARRRRSGVVRGRRQGTKS